METAVNPSQQDLEQIAQQSPQVAPALSKDAKPVWIEPDLDFIRALNRLGGKTLKKCFQCGTCSVACTLSPNREPFPRKEMAWATWGMKNRLLEDPDIWLCFQCNDCSTRCPRGARPGDVLAAVRRESIIHFAFPRFFGRWVNQPQCIPIMLGIPAALLTLALLLRTPIENALGISDQISGRIIYSYSNVLPHWLLNGFFMLFSILVILMVFVGVVRIWRAMKSAAMRSGIVAPAKGLFPSIVSAGKSIITHDKFDQCTKAHSRYLSHLSVFFGFLALSLVTIWVITAPYNPLIRDVFIYPFSFWSPWKILANLGGIAVVVGCLLMIRDRLKDDEQAGASTYFDWALIGTLLLVALSGFFTEVLHYVRLEPHRHLAYFVHLVFVGALLMYVPYSKFAHIIYRTTTLVCAEYYGRVRGEQSLTL